MSHKLPKILIVDDEVDLCEIIAYDFEGAGFEVQMASNGQEALSKFHSEKFDAIVSDIKMPVMDGISLLKNIRAKDHKTVFVFITAFAHITEEEALSCGVDGIFNKPFDRRELIHTVHKLLEPADRRWHDTTQAAQPDQVLNLKLKNYDENFKTHKLVIARGGFFLSIDKPRGQIGSTIGFKIEFEEKPEIILEGTGIIRWVRHTVKNNLHAGMGIEFVYLTEKSLEFVNREIKEKDPTAFIPMD